MNEISPAERLNRACFCVTLDDKAMRAALEQQSGDAGFYDSIVASRPHLFSQTPVFLPKADGEAMRGIIRAIEAAVGLPCYRKAIEAWAPDIALKDFGPRGAFMGYDFHLGDDGPKLIEINTNAGGAFLNAFLVRAQIACCAEVRNVESAAAFDDLVMAMFESEWRAQRSAKGPMRIAIVDDAPEQQYLYPEFILAQRMFEKRGHAAIVMDAKNLLYENGALIAAGKPVDLVYNRLVDFALEEPEHTALRAAYEAGAVVLTPNPHNHAMFADKRNLTLLSDPSALRQWGLCEDMLERLKGVPRTVRVTPANAEDLWTKRKAYFFKPSSGHGGKAVYRGDKITKGVWENVLKGDYVAQAFAQPSERTIELDGAHVQRKLDVRIYTYGGEFLLAAARLYQGQTTNFRTPGGGFAPVFFV